MIILETERLLLRHFIPDDMDALFALYRDPEMRRYFPDGTLTREETREEMEWYYNGHPKHPELGLWATTLKETGQFLGRCGLLPWTIDGVFEIEIAYMIDKRFWRQGFGAEAALGIRDYAFEKLGLTRLICLIDEENTASIKVAEKIGMTFEKEGEDELGPFHLYTIHNSQRNEA
ncbi:MAG: GNAT family N-acetyltransferase [Anaerolineae bacterium]|nr:GNAT family N-acetyltransferase [Anaerolineae bacterium]